MRKGDMEWVELHLQPLRDTILTLNEGLNKAVRHIDLLEKRTKDMKRDHKANVLAVDQACNSARSLLQQANRAARAVKIIDEDEPVADSGPLVNTAPTADDSIRAARARHPERTVL